MLGGSDLLIEMSVDLGMLPAHLKSIVRTAPLRYKVFTIPKRNGGLREVAQPARELKAMQRWLVDRLSKDLPLHDSATAYTRGASIKKNATIHVDSNYVLKMDFRNFFPSILMDDVVKHLSRYCSEKYDASAIRLAAYVCAWAPRRQLPLRLCIGAPSSPFLSNSVLYEFDGLVEKYASERRVRYTRYADDMTFSSLDPEALAPFPDMVRDVVAHIPYPRLTIHDKKTVFASRAGRRVVTGVTITSDKRLSIGRERKRKIRAMYHQHLLGKLDDSAKQELFGLIAFAEDIEPGFRVWLAGESRSNGTED